MELFAAAAAFWTILLVHRRRGGGGEARLTAALLVGAGSARAGWCLLFAPHAPAPQALLDAEAGFALLLVPLGPLLLCRRAFAALPLGFAVAKLGCLAADCCRGRAAHVPWALAGLHPTVAYEIGGLLLLHAVSRRAPERFTGPLSLGGFGLLRLGVEPLRAGSEGAGLLSPEAVAGLWIALAAAMVSFAPLRERDATGPLTSAGGPSSPGWRACSGGRGRARGTSSGSRPR